MAYDLLVKGGEVADPSQGIHGKFDIGIIEGKITCVKADIAASQGKEVIDAKGMIVTAGLIDIHAHAAEGIIDVGINPDELGIRQGVCTMCDGGSVGYANFLAVRKYIIPNCRTDLYWFIHISNTGQAVIPEIRSRYDINYEATLKTIEENRDVIKGVKLRAIGTVAQTVGIEAAMTAKRLASEAGLPLMVHLGACFSEIGVPGIAESIEPYTRQVLALLEKGDIITHIYSPKAGGVIKSDGYVLPELEEAIKRGVLLDVAHGGTNFSIEVARAGVERGIIPDMISTDASTVTISRTAVKGLARIVQSSVQGLAPLTAHMPTPSFSLATIMSKLMALGLTLDQVVEMTSIKPARAIGLEQRIGSLRPGAQADITLMEMVEKTVVFPDPMSEARLEGQGFLVPRLTLKSRGQKVEIIPLPSPESFNR